jgi:phytoene synthase
VNSTRSRSIIQSGDETPDSLVRRFDPDRYLATLFAPPARRPALFALFALNHELARIAETVREPLVADIRLAWWRDGVHEALQGRPRSHAILQGLEGAFPDAQSPAARFEAMLAARQQEQGPDGFPDMDALEDFVDATSGNLMRLAAELLGAPASGHGIFRHAGAAYGLAGLLRSAPFHAARGKSYLPRNLAKAPERARNVITERARDHYRALRRLPKPGKAFAALLPAALVPLYLRNPARDVPLYRRQLALLRAAITGRV